MEGDARNKVEGMAWSGSGQSGCARKEVERCSQAPLRDRNINCYYPLGHATQALAGRERVGDAQQKWKAMPGTKWRAWPGA
ncbi:MAG TPA: hypothetical protein DD811_04085, partial [Syntrophomonas sp.]|nr:hypothetical protein [Syntrophomonas sp.]